MEIHFFEKIDSTQKALLEDLKNRKVFPPIAYFTTLQTQGVGSRGNEWIGEEGNFFLSFALESSQLPKDLPLQSIAIYFMYQLKMVLEQKGSHTWLKWPNDLYLEKKKCGGCITNKVGDIIVCGIGINTKKAPEGFAILDIEIEETSFLRDYFALIEQKISWKQIFSKYKLEFHKSKSYRTHIEDKEILLENAELAEDGALIINGERVYSYR
ncbi:MULTISPECIES: biotin--[acetyl-CoA-carboxylase] ligase [unclassified Nitratiruptor]|uniref:biotin--[acetyl-CoA-carboxylase] ligase n=1 Tax=unclassified Nitratiruptor TaxID=2624044 RepID=UPI00191588D5|nr:MULTISPECIES: biotin--[acetyl-CoA-carboxylase] ligase [unclassified Nitratiruptor]BCD60049.1 BirA family transcriptional regulator, biotin operon repressor / biotin---[acetyl-CoA-carboxylase] ligase [Nitratiruptor sp. YY08-10]BCD64462.1 BirA family transcriptional regulator, biotin operon repressor / biotin---[acetyl-CoA-carboxylase] ligase [Nitratiruptor sp. YY08-14]